MLRLYIFLLALISLFVACNSKPQKEIASRIHPKEEKREVRKIAFDSAKTDQIKTPQPKIVEKTIDSLKAEKSK